MKVFGFFDVVIMKRIISILLASCILMLPTGCSTSKLLSMEEASLVKNNKYLLLHTPTKTYNLYNYKFSENTLEGNLAAFSKNSKARINVYTDQIFDLKPTPNNKQFISLNVINIQSIKYFKSNTAKMSFITIASVVSAYILASLVIDEPISTLALGNGGR